MASDGYAELTRRLSEDEALRARFAQATSEADVLRMASDIGIAVAPEDLADEATVLTDADLAAVAGGTAGVTVLPLLCVDFASFLRPDCGP
jgi:predicted ribosomally synthesized peptide with nif11-like leader